MNRSIVSKKFCRTGWLVEKNFEILQNFPWRIRNPTKKWFTIPSSDEGDMITTSPGAPYSNLLRRTPIELKFCGRPHFLLLAWCEQLRSWPWRHSKINYTLGLHWTAYEPAQGSKNDQTPKGVMAVPYEKKGCHDTPKINASVEGQNWGSTNVPLFSRVNERVKREREVQAINEWNEL